MAEHDKDNFTDTRDRASQAAGILARIFSEAGWRVREPKEDVREIDMIVRRGKASYAIELKGASEGRSDRLIPLWSQGYLQAARAAAEDHPPLVVVAAPRIGRRAAERVIKFAQEYAPNAAAGVIDFTGLRLFYGPHLQELNSDPAESSVAKSLRTEPTDLFSDLNQWMLKVLLAPELPDRLLSAPRGRYSNASQLARAANVSVMSAFRLVDQLERGGYLHESRMYLTLVRREDLFKQWQNSAARRVKEIPMRFVLRGTPQVELRRMLKSGRACLAMFAAAEALQLGFVHGVPPHVYVQRLRPVSLSAWKNLIVPQPGEPPHVIVREPAAPQSVFRAIVHVDHLPVTDVIQVWLDVSSHPARGKEQAELIQRKVIDKLFQPPPVHG
jgi:hypothetical protein